MQLSTASGSSSKRSKCNSSGSRLRKKHKRLDAICEEEYTRNHGEPNEDNGAAGDTERRRSSRVRRAPVVLDVSPQPVKKRLKIDKNATSFSPTVIRRENEDKNGDKNEDLGDLESIGGWKSRLRARGRNLDFGVKERRASRSGKRKHFEGIGGNEDEGKDVERELDENKGGFEGRNWTIVKAARSGRIKASNCSGDKQKDAMTSGRIKASNGLGDKEKDVELNVIKDDNDKNGEDVVGGKGEEDMTFLEGGVTGGNEMEIVDGNVEQLVESEKGEISDGLRLEECADDESIEKVEQSDKQVEQLELGKEGVNQMDVVEVVGVPTNQEEDGGCTEGVNQEDASLVNLNEKPLEDETALKVDGEKRASARALGKPRFKEGRRCGLCGGGTDGKPPKKLVHNVGESENEAYSGSSASEDPTYDVWDGFGDEPGWLGRLLGPINDRYGIAGIWVHQHCAVWSPEVYFAGLGCLKNVRAALCRGRALKCSRCGRPGATIGCRVDRCPKTYHLPCARANGCVFDHRKFLIACTDHCYLFQPHGNKYLLRIKKMKAKKMKLETRKLANDSWRKDIEAEEKWLENCGEDEEFLKRESRRLHRDLLRIAPVYIGGPNSESRKLFQGWESVAGLQDVIRCMKEVVILPLLYPEFFDNLGLTPPRGVLLHGYPGTGKTLVVRALIGSCARGDRKIAYFARKGADCLGKYVGDAERQLRLLFQVAERCQPSIIFFDEIDGLAPCRTRQQDQTHSSVVSTLLALMDGLKSRGSVVVIGATNRPEAVDPALRRPGRFDREIYFPLPSVEDRAAILSLHTQKWPKPVAGTLLKWIARRTAGFAGADLQALCTQAAIIALKRNFPLQEILSAAEKKAHGGKRHPLPAFAVEESDWLEALSCAPPPCSRREAGIAANDVVSSPLPTHLIPSLLQPLSNLLVSLYLDERLWLPPALSKAVRMFRSVIVSALDKKKMPSGRWWLHANNILHEADVAKEIERKLCYAGMLMGDGNFSCSEAFNEDADDNNVSFEPYIVHNGKRHTSLSRNISFASRKKSGFRILIAGSPKCGQRHLASCLLHCFVGNVEIQKIDSATISQEGRGDVMQGLAQILMKCASMGSCVVFMPRIDLWALEKRHQVPEESDSASSNDQYVEKRGSCFTHSEIVDKENDCCQQQCESAEVAEYQSAPLSPSDAWGSFIEQVDSLCMSTSMMILATSEVPYPLLPDKIRQFFKGGMLDCSQSTALERARPQFSVRVDGNFDHDTMINLSALELSRDIIQQVVQLIHQKSHCRTSLWKGYKTCNSVEVDPDAKGQPTDHRSANEHEGGQQCPADPIERPPPLANTRIVKGKSNLLLAISTFGYQILRYPHFAELCWVTSKLKEGPCADVNGPWKGWPFNSCIVRPINSLGEGHVACSSSNIKSKERSGLVRGLLAVGLSAYRGVYTSLREVSLEVRKVLELLVGQIDAKIQAGKDRYQYVRVLSQVAYLEDVVNSWAYALQSLDQDAQVIAGNPKLTTVAYPDNNHTCEDDAIQREEDKANVSNSHESEVLEESPQGFAENMDCVDLNKRNGDIGYPSSKERVAVSGEGYLQEMAPLSPSIPVRNPDSCAATDQVINKTSNEQNGTIIERCESGNTRNLLGVNGDSEALRESNRYVLKESVVLSENGPSSSGDPGGVKFSCSTEACDQINDLSLMETGIISDDGNPDDHIVDTNFSSGKTTTLPADSGVACLYRCCTECLYTLNSLMQKILIREWGLNTKSWTVDGVHDVVASLSVDLLSAVRNVYLAKSFSNSWDEKLRYKNCGKLYEHADLMTCKCKISEACSLAMPLECSCHTLSKLETAKANTSPNTQFRSDLTFIFRDGVLVPSDPDKNVSFHCKFETLCLCSLLKVIVMTKRPFD